MKHEEKSQCSQFLRKFLLRNSAVSTDTEIKILFQKVFRESREIRR